ncbi:hypothetical protein Syun_015071 [Stephania yunnanensis]|uniref:Adipocyte plasma membrane-associated protein n=1 Tax=Stephania yunnanensis TaxID=152371 RepID=A0AAP0JKG7_9MAGN
MAKTDSPPYLRLSLIFLSISLPSLLFQLLLNRFDELNPAPHPPEALSRVLVPVRKHFDRIVEATERIGDGLVDGPEDFAYDAESGVVYTSCADGWIRRVKVGDSVVGPAVEKWVRVGGRPLGLALRPDKMAVLVAEAYKGLMQVTMEGHIELLTDEAEG